MVDRMAVLSAVAKEMQKFTESVRFYVGKAVLNKAMTLDEIPTKAENTADPDDELDELDRQIEAEIAAQLDEDTTVVSVPYRLWNLHHAEVMSDCNQSYHKTDTGDGAYVRGCPNDLITALFIIVSKHEERGWTR